jgi:hypothetical protein
MSDRAQGRTEGTKQDAQRINACRAGPLPAFVEDLDEDEDEPQADSSQLPDAESTDFPDEPLEEGDRIWVMGLFPEAEHI